MAPRVRRMPLIGAMLVSFCFLFKGTLTSGAGRAFPIASENYVIENFRRINSRLEWDPTNFLVDLSGQYANCRLLGARGDVKIDRLTQEGNTISGYVDYTDGPNADVNSVNGYLKRVIDRWMAEEILFHHIRGSDRFGCSVRPGCDGRVAVGCLFSPGGNGEPPPSFEENIPKALAFTPEQYRTAEGISGKSWDRSHFLENLSGLETDCSMVKKDDWQFTQVQKWGKNLLGIYGYERNEGSTPQALQKILTKMKTGFRAVQVGCSVIPDCMYNSQMYVVVSCIFQEY